MTEFGVAVDLDTPAEELERRWKLELVVRAHSIPHLHSLHELDQRPDSRTLLWSLALELPLIARALVPRDALRLRLEERFTDGESEFLLHSMGLPQQAAVARGMLRFVDEGRGGRFQVQGRLHVDPAAVRIPASLLGPQIEIRAARALERAFTHLGRSLA